MRFSAPRSFSPSPIRGKPRHQSTFGLQSDSDYDSDSGSDPDSSDSGESTSSSSTDSFCYASDYEAPVQPLRPTHAVGNPAERRYIEDTVAAIRLRTRHHDPYEEWEKQTRKDAFRTARKELAATQSQLHDAQDRTRAKDTQRLAALHAQQMAEVKSQLDALRLKQQSDEEKLREGWKERDKKLWERIESVIRLEENKVRTRLEEERKAKEEEERKRKEEELRRRLVEEKRRQEEELKKKEEEEAQRLKDEQRKKQDDENQQKLDEERAKVERLQAEEEQRRQLGLTTADEDWRQARTDLHQLKTDSMKFVKSNKDIKSEWGKWRRQITPKIGQLTDDQKAISHISTQLFHIVNPSHGPHTREIHIALLSSLAKAILLQAETEVTAERRSAGPLAQVTFNLLDTLDGFPEIFYAKLVQRVGGWPVPVVVPSVDHDGVAWKDEAARTKAMGYRKSAISDDIETAAEYTARIAGVMRVYFCILKIPPRQQPLKPMFQLPRYWTWVARLMSERGLLETAVAPQLLYTALDVLGSHAKDVWGQQWIKMLGLMYEGVTVGFGAGRFIGGQSPEGKAARVRVQMEVERIMAAVR